MIKAFSTECLKTANPKHIWHQNVEGVRKANVKFVHESSEIFEYARCKTDIIYFAETYCKIYHLDVNAHSNVILRSYQKDIIEKYSNNKFTANLCSRQTGMTTVIAILALHEILFSNDNNVFIVSHKLANAVEKLDKIKQLYLNLPYFMKPGVTLWNINKVDFENGSSIKLASNAKNIRGYTLDKVFIDDFAHIYDAEDIIRNIIPVSATRKKDKIMICSTPGGYFNKLFEDAERKDGDPKKNLFVPTRVYWWEVSGRDEEWKNKEILNMGSEELFNREYDLKMTRD